MMPTIAMSFAPGAPWPLVVALGIVAVALALRLSPGAGAAVGTVRAVALLAISGVLLSPSTRIRSPEDSDQPMLTVLVDTSASMATCDVAGEAGPSRLESLGRRWTSTDAQQSLADVARLRFAAFDESVRPLEVSPLGALDATGSASEIAGAVRETVGVLGSGDHVLLLSDGASTGGEPITAAASDAVARGVTVHAASAGSADALADMAVALSVDQERVFAGESTRLRAKLRHVGDVDRDARVRISETTASGSERIIFDGTVDLESDIALDVTPPSPQGAERSTVVYRATVLSNGSDADPRNNESFAGVLVSAAPLRVVVIEGRPSWQTRFVTEALAADPRFDTTSLSRLGDGVVARRFSAEDEGSSSIALADAIGAADVFVFGRSIDAILQAADGARIAAAVLEGGRSIVFLRGDPFSTPALPWRDALDSIAPVRWGAGELEDASPVATPDAPHPVRDAIERMRGVLASHSDSEDRSLSDVWLRGETGVESRTTIASMRAGAGVSMAVLSDGLWQWAMSADASSAAAFDEFWSLTIRSLVGEPLGAFDDVTLDIAPLAVTEGESVAVHVRAQTSVTVSVIDPSGGEAVIVDGDETAPATRTRKTFESSDVGMHRVVARNSLGSEVAGAVFFVTPPLAEQMAVQAQPDAMAALAAATGGLSLDAGSVEALADAIAASDESDVVSAETEFEPLWDTPWVFGLIVLLLLSEWVVRRSRGFA